MVLENAFKPEVTYSFIKYPDETFKPIVANIIVGMMMNPSFPDCQSKVVALETAFNQYAPTVVEKERQNAETAALRVERRVPVEAALEALLPAAQAESGGNLVKLMSTNIPLGRNPETPQPPQVPSGLRLYLFGNPAQLYVQCPAQDKAQFYCARISHDGDNWEWQETDTKSAVAFSNLPQGETLYVQMMVKNSVSKGPWCGSLSFTIPEPGVTVPMYKRPRGVR